MAFAMKYLQKHYGKFGPRFAIAPMMDWTDRHCRFFHRLMTKHALLYTEMIVADAIIHGDRDYLLGFDENEHPVALQLGGSDPDKLAEGAKIGEQFGYDEVNLNIGCPSDRVQSGVFGAFLMREPELVGRCVSAMKEAVNIPVTVKCRIGVDEQDAEIALDNLSNKVWSRAADGLWVHARKAWLEGLSPKENRDIPPLDYDRVHRLKLKNQSHFIGINGGIENLIQVQGHLENVDGVMLGRAAYHNPSMLMEVDALIFGDEGNCTSFNDVLEGMTRYAELHLSNGGKLNQITRHMIGLFQGVPGARAYRQILSTKSIRPGAGPEILEEAFSAVAGSVNLAA
ncbi:MAG: tRNA dihydrouridine(20/20a) synthase DusA [Rhizobiaceae bacterium]